MPLGLDTLNPATLLSGRYKQEQFPDLTGRTALVTGGSAGIGYYNVLGLARAGAKVLFLSADAEKGRKAEEDLNAFLSQHGPEAVAKVKYHQVDLSDLKAADAFAKEVAESEDRLDIVINNAGIGQAPHGITEDGLERHYEVNNLAHYVITLRLLPLLLKTAANAPPLSVRIVMQSSELHRAAPSDTKFASIEELNEPRDATVAYGRSKLGNIYFARQLVKRKLPPAGSRDAIVIGSVHPGTVDTNIQDQVVESYGVLGKVIDPFMRTIGKSAPEGAEASLWLATTTDISSSNLGDYQGNYYKEAYGKPGTESDLAKNEEVADAFWTFSAARTKEILGEELQ